MSSTALGAKAPKTKKIIFISQAHEKFYYLEVSIVNVMMV